MKAGAYFNFGLNASTQMGLDQAIFEELERKGNDLFLRFYTIEPQAFTLGYFIKDLPRGFGDGIPVVRRLTGGGIVSHGQDLVFALGAKRDALPFLKSTSESYAAIHTVIQEAYRDKFVTTELVSCKEAQCAKPANALKNVCFQNPVPGDLVAGKEKIAGGAQKREKGFFLHQGSLRLKYRTFDLEARDFSEVLLNTFSEKWDLDIEIEELSPRILKRARELAETKYRPLGALVK